MRWMLLFCTGLFLMTPLMSQADIAMVASKGSTLSDVAQKDVRLLYLGKRSEIDGVAAVPVALPFSHISSLEFGEIVLNKTKKQLHTYWGKLIFTGKGTPPKEVMSAAEVKQWIVENSKGVGYINISDVDDSVKVIAVFK